MHSPPDPASPSPSTPSSGSPPPEEANYQGPSQGTASQILNFASHLSSSLTGSPKRRLPPGPAFGASSNNRDHKSRRRGDTGRQGSLNNWEQGGKETGKRDKEELLDMNLVEYLRKEIGDPFQNNAFKNAS